MFNDLTKSLSFLITVLMIDSSLIFWENSRPLLKLNFLCYNSVNATTSDYSINPQRKEVIVMMSVFSSLVVGVVAGVIACYIYDKFIK